MENKASMTALMSSFGRAFYTEQTEHPIFSDSAARSLLTDEEYRGIQSTLLGGVKFLDPDGPKASSPEQALRRLVFTRIAPTPVGRARFFEDSLDTAVRTGTSQYVILGAGLDTFAFRRPDFLKKYPVFEVDHPLTQEDKLRRIRRAGLELPENLRFVPVDFCADSLPEKLRAAGFDCRRKTFFSLPGVSYYLSEAETDALLDGIASLSAEGSTLVFDYAAEPDAPAENSRMNKLEAMASSAGEPMKSRYTPAGLTRLLERHHFLIYEHLDPSEMQERYFSGSDGLRAVDSVCCALAVFKPPYGFSSGTSDRI